MGAAAMSLAMVDMFAGADVAHAAGREDYGILAGRSVALVHPIGLAAALGLTLWAGYTGLQWRSLRTLGDDIKAVKAKMPEDEESAEYKSLSKEMDELKAKRKELSSGNFRDRHFNAGSILLGGGVLLGIEGAMNTYMRVGKLFPGPHLFAGASIVILWALAAALTPAMQRGNDNARSAHIALNSINVGLFLWQVPTGWEIVLKVFQFTEWP
uniref:DUF4079 domain-containing protein n=2 Tax=Viridiplantae TaxID=33090 RepID=A0A7R9TR63_9VIRI|mmetsp:Transcript_5032/g.20035  ORF Transcript_5032/g.20035 Transcript_5032/m.20035 type:complete len:212 (+) Transcript_5032:199-834(+)